MRNQHSKFLINCRTKIFFVFATIFFSLLINISITRAEPCPGTPCLMGIDSCRDNADWVVEATVKKFTDGGFIPVCEPFLLSLTGKCGAAQQSPVLSLSRVKILKGVIPSENGIIEIRRQASCFGNPMASGIVDPSISPYLDKTSVGHRFRFYGNHVHPEWPHLEEGFLLVEPLPASGER